MSLSFSLILLLHEFTIYYFWRMVCCLRFPPLLVYYCERFSRNVSSLSLSFSLSFCYYVKFYSDSDSDSTMCNSPLRIANHLVMDSCCRGGIVNTRGVFLVRTRVPRRFGGFNDFTRQFAIFMKLRSTRYSSM